MKLYSDLVAHVGQLPLQVPHKYELRIVHSVQRMQDCALFVVLSGEQLIENLFTRDREDHVGKVQISPTSHFCIRSGLWVIVLINTPVFLHCPFNVVKMRT